MQNALTAFEFNGPLDMDLFYQNGTYYLSEINPRFGGAYLHAYGAGVDFPAFIYKNVKEQKANEPCIGAYEEEVVMMMYDSVVIKKLDDIKCNVVSL